MVTALCTGARQGELLRLRWRDVDLDRGIAVIHHSKNGDRRALAITGLAAQVLIAMSGATLAELAEALGHKTLLMVKRYAHLTEGHTMGVIARMTERFMAG